MILEVSFKIVTEKPRYKMETFIALREKKKFFLINWFGMPTGYENLPAITHVKISPKKLRQEACSTTPIGYRLHLTPGVPISMTTDTYATYAKKIAEKMKKYKAS
jgi:hypothetical protein